MTESSPAGPADDSWKDRDGWENFDVKEFARQTAWTIESRDEDDHVDQLRLVRIEECIAARWPRRWLLWARLRREIRASVATWDDDYIPKNDFTGRRLEWAMQQPILAHEERRRRHEARRQQRQAEAPEDGRQGGADPGAGFLP